MRFASSCSAQTSERETRLKELWVRGQKYALKLIMARLAKGAATCISMAFLVM
jgi:hypothetical protein